MSTMPPPSTPQPRHISTCDFLATSTIAVKAQLDLAATFDGYQLPHRSPGPRLQAIRILSEMRQVIDGWIVELNSENKPKVAPEYRDGAHAATATDDQAIIDAEAAYDAAVDTVLLDSGD